MEDKIKRLAEKILKCCDSSIPNKDKLYWIEQELKNIINIQEFYATN